MYRLILVLSVVFSIPCNAQTYQWAFNVGSTTFSDQAWGIVTDGGGNVIVTGLFRNVADFDPSGNVANLNGTTNADLFVAKYDAAGNYLWAFKINTSSVNNDVGITVDDYDNIYVTGNFNGTADFDPSGNVANLTTNGFQDVFVAKYDPNGNYLWAFNIGGTSDDWGYNVAADSLGFIYITGPFQNTVDFDPSGNTANLTSNGQYDAYVAKYDSSGNYQWAFNLGASEDDNSYDIDSDVNGNLYVIGAFRNTVDFDPSGNTANVTATDSTDIFVAKYDSGGNYQWAFNVGSTSADQGYGIAIDTIGIGGVYVTGFFNGTADFDPSGNTANLTSNAGRDIFVAKYDTSSNYQWAFNVGGSNWDIGYEIATDPSGTGAVYVTGSFQNTVDFDPSGNIANLSGVSNTDIFIAKYDANGNYRWAFEIASMGDNYGTGITPGPAGADIYATGNFRQTPDFDPSTNTINLTSNGLHDFYVAKYDTACPVAAASVNNDTTICSGETVNLVASGGNNYQWVPGAGLNDSTIANPIASPNVSTTYMVVVSTTCYSDTAYVTIDVNPSYNFIDSAITICNGDSVLVYGNYETASGTYYNSFLTVNGCDSIYSTDLTFSTVDTSVSKSGNILIAGAIIATWQWIWCDSAIVPGANNQAFAPVTNGSYAVIVTENGCTDTSACYTITGIGISENQQNNNLTIHPNPTTGIFRVAPVQPGRVITVIDLFGRPVVETYNTEIDMAPHPAGIYFVKAGGVVRKLVVQ